MAPVRPGGSVAPPQPVPRFERSLDALLRDGVVSPREVRVRGLIKPGNEDLVREGCSSGAFSARECGTAGVVVRSRDGGEVLYGEPGGSAGGASSGYDRAGGGGSGIDAAPLPPIAVPVTALLSGVGGRFRLTDVFNLSPRPGGLRGNGNSRMLYPLIGGSEVSSGFGWRMHPILGSWMMHSGRDLAAPEGTPVVAALSGRVVSSGDAGGYGLAVEIDHDNPRRRTLYGHLSEIYVREGERVRQGDVIGRVGSTGRSTGPHLHFELRMPQEGGWVAVDPGEFDTGAEALGAAGTVAGLPGLPGILAPGTGQPPDAVALLLGQLVQSLERPRSPLGTPDGSASGAPRPVPFPTDRLPERLPPSASVPAPAPLPRREPSAATPGR